VCRVEGSHATLEKDDDNSMQLYISSKDVPNLEKWNKFDKNATDKAKNFAYLRSIGFYDDGVTDKLIGLDRVV